MDTIVKWSAFSRARDRAAVESEIRRVNEQRLQGLVDAGYIRDGKVTGVLVTIAGEAQDGAPLWEAVVEMSVAFYPPQFIQVEFS